MASPIPTGRRASTYVTVFLQGPPVMDGDGHWNRTWMVSDVPWFVSIEPATLREQERRQGSTLTADNSSLVTGPYRADITTAARLKTQDGVMFDILSVASPERRNIELVAICMENTVAQSVPVPLGWTQGDWIQPNWSQ